MVPLGAVVAPRVAGGGAEAERALGDGGAAALAGGAAGLGVLDGDGRLGGRRGRHCSAGDANDGGEEEEAGVSEEEGCEHARWGWAGAWRGGRGLTRVLCRWSALESRRGGTGREARAGTKRKVGKRATVVLGRWPVLPSCS